MKQEQITQLVLSGAERWKALKDRQYELRLPSGVYASDLPVCITLAGVQATPEEDVQEIQNAAALLAELRKDSRLSGVLASGSDVTAILSLALLMAEEVPEQGSMPDMAEYPAASAVPEPGPCAPCAEKADRIFLLEHEVSDLSGRLSERPECPAPAQATLPVAVGACPHVASDGKCADCTEQKTEDCYACDKTIVVANGRRCKMDEDDCGHLYCSDCADDKLNEHGYCEDCAVISCSGCDDEELDRGTETRCSKQFCKSAVALCDTCKDEDLNGAGECPDCSGEDRIECNGCERNFTGSRITACKDEDCNQDFCAACKDEGLNEHGYCEDCRTCECSRCDEEVPRGTEKSCVSENCDDVYCAACAADLLNEAGKCSGCTDEEEVECGGCERTFISSRATACTNDCGHTYCPACLPENLTGGWCQDCREERE